MAKLKTDAVVKELRAFGLRFPKAGLKSPWPGHKDLAVNDKTFAYLSIEGEPFSMSCKLPASFAELALMMPFTAPTGYGLGKSGWVTATFDARANIPIDLLKTWITESYRLQAPKKLVAGLDEVASATAKRRAKPAKPAKTAKKR